MALVKRSTPKSRSTQSLDRVRKNLAVHVSLSVFNFQTAALNQRQVRNRSLGNNPQHPGEAQKRRRSAAAPSRWPRYRSHHPRLSTRFLKFFRQPRRSDSGAPETTRVNTLCVARPRAQAPVARKQPHSDLRAASSLAAGLIPVGDAGMVRRAAGTPPPASALTRLRAGPRRRAASLAPICPDFMARARRSGSQTASDERPSRIRSAGRAARP
jgi:hypothetical protein